MRRAAALLALLIALAAPASPALAQTGGGAFGPLPPAVTPSPSPSPEPEGLDQDDVSTPFLFGIVGAVVLLFVGIGVFISRDARSNLTDSDRRALERSEHPKPEEEKRQAVRARKKARAKTRAQKQARKKQRR